MKGKSGGPDSHGFCLLNNISIGAAYALNAYRNDLKKVAIVDFGEINIAQFAVVPHPICYSS